ncbi:MAG: rspR 3 [Deltaproteobacteria bacterium]|nr:rspR 3 [Deltaproteobacteria bacterium]
MSVKAIPIISKRHPIPVREKTYDFLKSNILSGHFQPGHRLIEEDLAEELGVSRTPVREAFHKLELEGLITPLETRGFIVPKDSKGEMEELFEIRSILEGHALRIIAEVVSDETIDRLNSLVEKADEAFREKDLEGIYASNTQFHDLLNTLLIHKPRLYGMIVNIRKYVLRYRKDTLQYLSGARRTIDGHRRIILALKLKDPNLCEQMMRRHIQEAKEDALKRIFEER